jgi:transglutaminase-like putative cysteine protease
MTCDIIHRTLYTYSAPVTVSQHAARVEPRSLPNHQFLESFQLRIEPEPSIRKVRTDYFGNQICFFSIQEVHTRLEIIAECRVSVAELTPPTLFLSPEWEDVSGLFSDPVSPNVVEPYEFVFDSPLLRASPALADYARQSFKHDGALLASVMDLNRRIHADFKYDKIATTVATPLEEVIENRRGVCQDFAHFAIACLRSLGLPARYVSGYLRTVPPKGKPGLVGADASHAWFSVFCPGIGWVDFDPTNNMMPGTDHVTLAYGRDFADVSPVSGIITGGGRHKVKAGVTVSVL